MRMNGEVNWYQTTCKIHVHSSAKSLKDFWNFWKKYATNPFQTYN